MPFNIAGRQSVHVIEVVYYIFYKHCPCRRTLFVVYSLPRNLKGTTFAIVATRNTISE